MTHRSDPLDQELQRSRRYERPLSLVRVRPRNGDVAQLIGLLETMAREVDQVWAVGPDVVVLLPEADAQAAQAFVDRACDPFAGSLVRDATTASFPEDGLTRPALFAALNGQPGTRVEAPAVGPRPTPVPLPVRRSGASRGSGDADREDDRPRRRAG